MSIIRGEEGERGVWFVVGWIEGFMVMGVGVYNYYVWSSCWSWDVSRRGVFCCVGWVCDVAEYESAEKATDG